MKRIGARHELFEPIFTALVWIASEFLNAPSSITFSHFSFWFTRSIQLVTQDLRSWVLLTGQVFVSNFQPHMRSNGWNKIWYVFNLAIQKLVWTVLVCESKTQLSHSEKPGLFFFFFFVSKTLLFNSAEIKTQTRPQGKLAKLQKFWNGPSSHPFLGSAVWDWSSS